MDTMVRTHTTPSTEIAVSPTHRSILKRPLLLLGVVAALVLTAAAPVAAGGPPEKQTGQFGHYDVRDSSDAPVVNCRYATTSKPKLDKFVAKVPRIWWPDTNSDNDRQHGKVGWQVRIQGASNPVDGPWLRVFTSSTVKAIAYEDQPFGDVSDAAPLTIRGFTWDRSGTGVYRVVYKLFWYNGDGSVKGSITHWIDNYKLTGSVSSTLQGFCPNRLFN